jgi:hypothetical protein
LNKKSFAVYPSVPRCLSPEKVKILLALKDFDSEDSKKNGESKTLTYHLNTREKCQTFEKFILLGTQF